MRVAVAGATGRMGSVAREVLSERGEYLCGLARRADPSRGVVDDVERFLAAKPDVVLDLSVQPASYAIACAALRHGVPTVVGSSGWSDEQRAAFAALARERACGALIVPNFSLGAALMMRFAREAARHFADAEIVEMHRREKRDAPSGTALETAARMGRPATPIHSVRLPGLIAHQSVIFAGGGEMLTIRHDTLDRRSFAAGMLAAVRYVGRLRELRIGLDEVLDAAAGGA